MEKLIAKDLLSIKAVFFRPDQPFTWASGIKSPVYCDNRLTLTAPKVRDDVENGLAKLIKEHYPEAEVLMGTSTAGIAHAAITAHILDMPMGYGMHCTGLAIMGEGGAVTLSDGDSYYSFKKQLDRFVEFLRTGVADHPFEDTIEMAKIIAAGIRSREEAGRIVMLDEIKAE